MKQLDLFEGMQLRDLGIKQSESHANEVEQNWSEKAYSFLVNFCRSHRVFMAEDIRDSSIGIVPEPPSQRAWGAIFVKAAKSGLIKRVGYGQVKNPKAHCTPAAIWAVI